jgi:CRISPR-associated protein Csd1
VVRDWLETTLVNAQWHLARYFVLQRLRAASTGAIRYCSLYELAGATINAQSDEKPTPQVIRALLRLALAGDPLPRWLLQHVIRRTRAERRVRDAHAALLKMVLLSAGPQREQDKTMSELGDMPELPAGERRAYTCGQLLATLGRIQEAALGSEIGSSVLDRYYGTASSAPIAVFARLLRGAQGHLSKLRRSDSTRGAYFALDKRLQEILAGIEPAQVFPRALSLREQVYFALGVYHEKAEQTRARNERQAQPT